jgi:hypothetical protein
VRERACIVGRGVVGWWVKIDWRARAVRVDSGGLDDERGELVAVGGAVGEGEGRFVVVKAMEERVRSAREGWRESWKEGLVDSMVVVGSCLGGSRLMGDAEDVGCVNFSALLRVGVFANSSGGLDSRMPRPDNAVSIADTESSGSSRGGSRTGVVWRYASFRLAAKRVSLLIVPSMLAADPSPSS